MASFLVPLNIKLRYTTVINKYVVVKYVRVVKADDVINCNNIFEISLGEKGKDTFFVGLSEEHISLLEDCKIELLTYNKFYMYETSISSYEIPVGSHVIPETGIVTQLIEPLYKSIVAGDMICLIPGTKLYDNNNKIDFVLNKKCLAKVHRIYNIMKL